MRYTKLGQSDIFISRIAAGGVLRGSEKDFIRGLHLAFDHGVNAVDTAPIYGCGASEAAVGKAIATHRKRIVVMTKVGIRWDDDRGRPLWTTQDARGAERLLRLNSSPKSLELEVERSLGRLGVERIDLLQIHQHDPDTPLDAVMETLERLAQAGKVRAIGVSNFPVALASEASKYLGRVPLAAVQSEYSLLSRKAENDYFPAARANRWGVLVCRALAQGALARQAGPVPTDSRRFAPEFAWSNRAKIVRALEQTTAPIARRHNATLGQIALAWVLRRNEVASVITAASTERQAFENATAIEINLDAEEHTELTKTFQALNIDQQANTSLFAKAERLLRRVVG